MATGQPQCLQMNKTEKTIPTDGFEFKESSVELGISFSGDGFSDSDCFCANFGGISQTKDEAIRECFDSAFALASRLRIDYPEVNVWDNAGNSY
tara:strand:+ start:100 stop:381 length:282 start_codon:yes stop_codon:yes gene_type:complete